MFAAGWLLGRALAKAAVEEEKRQEKAERERVRGDMRMVICTYLREHPNSTGGAMAKALDIPSPKLNGYLTLLQREGRIIRANNGGYTLT